VTLNGCSIKFADKKAAKTISLSNKKTIAIIDSGTSFILMPEKAHSILVEHFRTVLKVEFYPDPGPTGKEGLM